MIFVSLAETKPVTMNVYCPSKWNIESYPDPCCGKDGPQQWHHQEALGDTASQAPPHPDLWKQDVYPDKISGRFLCVSSVSSTGSPWLPTGFLPWITSTCVA